MYCRNCGQKNPEDSVFCSKCGTKYQHETNPVEPLISEDEKSKTTNLWTSKVGSLNYPLIIGLIVLAAVLALIPKISNGNSNDAVNSSLNNNTSVDDTSNSENTSLEGKECSNPDEIRIIDGVTYQCIGHGAFYWQIVDNSLTSSKTKSWGSPEETSIRNTLIENCNSLPSSFESLMFQRKGSTFNAYGEPLVIYGLGLLRLSVYDAGDHYRWGPYQDADILILDTWNCRYPADAPK